MANAKSAGIIMGAKAPVVLVSRADTHESKLYSIAYGAIATLTYMANAKSAGIIMGAKAPVVLVSRADTHESKLYSIAYGAIATK